MGRGFMFVAGVALVALLLMTMAATLRLLVLLVELVTLRYTLAIGALAFTCWFVDSRRRRYAKGFYSCSQVPQTQLPQQMEEKTVQPEVEQETEEEKTQMTAAVSPEAHPEMLPGHKVATVPPSETESEEDDSEAGGEVSISKTSTPFSRHSMSLMDVRTRSHTANEYLQWQEDTRPRSSSAVGDSRPSKLNTRGKVTRSSNLDGTEQKRRVLRRRADTGMTNNSKQNERSRRATFASKQDVCIASRKSSSDRVEDALRSDGYWIGDFRVQRRLVSRRSHTNSPKAN